MTSVTLNGKARQQTPNSHADQNRMADADMMHGKPDCLENEEESVYQGNG